MPATSRSNFTWRTQFATASMILAAFLCQFGADAAQAKERQSLAVSYLLAPPRPMPEHVRTVAVIDAGVESDEERRQSREQKWQEIAADLIESMVQSGSNSGVPGALRVVDRRATRQILAEKDMQLVGIVEGSAATNAGKLLAVDALVMSRVKISIDYRRTRSTKIDWTGILGGSGPSRGPAYRSPYHRGPNNPYQMRPPARRSGPGFPTKTIEEISRDLTVQCSFSLIDANTGESIVRYTPPVYQKRDKAKPNFMFGGRVDPSELDPVDHFIGELVERASREFVSLITPVRATYVYSIELRGRDAEPAVRMLRADDYEGALQALDAAYRKKPKESDYIFTMGLISEIMGRPDRALDFYRQTVSAKKVDKDKLDTYMSAKDRLTEHMDRIILNGNQRSGGGLVVDNGDNDDDKEGKRKRDRDRDDDDEEEEEDDDDD